MRKRNSDWENLTHTSIDTWYFIHRYLLLYSFYLLICIVAWYKILIYWNVIKSRSTVITSWRVLRDTFRNYLDYFHRTLSTNIDNLGFPIHFVSRKSHFALSSNTRDKVNLLELIFEYISVYCVMDRTLSHSTLMRLRIIPHETNAVRTCGICTYLKTPPGKREYELGISILNLFFSSVHPSRYLSSCNYSVSQS